MGITCLVIHVFGKFDFIMASDYARVMVYMCVHACIEQHPFEAHRHYIHVCTRMQDS